ncbi:TIGR04150 pseudo-rSAM protein [Bacteroidota bacterium]
MNHSRWLFLEPYVHLIHRGGTLLLYNTVSKKVLEFPDAGELIPLADELLVPENGYVTQLTPIQLEKREIIEFIEQLRQHFFGDLLDPEWSEGRPVNIFPEPAVKHGFSSVPEEGSPLKPGLNLRNYLQEITLYLNSETASSAPGVTSAFRQFSYPVCITQREEEMDLNLFRALIDDVNQYTPTLIHISGWNLLSYSGLEDVISKLVSSPFQKKYHLLAEHWEKRIIPFILIQKRSSVALYITFPTEPDTILGYLHSLPDEKMLKKLEFNFVVSSQEELEMALEIIPLVELENLFLKPIYTGRNIDFFKENVFVSKEEIMAAQPNQQQLLSRISMNENDFGKLFILPGGETFANLNDPTIGHATEKSLTELVAQEINHGTSWRRTRSKVNPCSSCLYQFLCPPISSYEVLMNRYNFCDVYPTKGAV